MRQTSMRALTSELWDAELEGLILKVGNVLGEQTLSHTIERAFLRQRLTGAIKIDLFRAAVKAELRAAVRPH